MADYAEWLFDRLTAIVVDVEPEEPAPRIGVVTVTDSQTDSVFQLASLDAAYVAAGLPSPLIIQGRDSGRALDLSPFPLLDFAGSNEPGTADLWRSEDGASTVTYADLLSTQPIGDWFLYAENVESQPDHQVWIWRIAAPGAGAPAPLFVEDEELIEAPE